MNEANSILSIEVSVPAKSNNPTSIISNKLSKDWGQKRGAITEVLTPLSFFTEKTNTKKN